MTENTFNQGMLKLFLFEADQLNAEIQSQLQLFNSEKIIKEENLSAMLDVVTAYKLSAQSIYNKDIYNTLSLYEEILTCVMQDKEQEQLKKASEFCYAIGQYLTDSVKAFKNMQEPETPAKLSKDMKQYIAKLKGEEVLEALDVSESLEEVSTDSVQKEEYEAEVHFDSESGLLNIRAFTVIRNIQDMCSNITYVPEDLINDLSADGTIAKEGFHIKFGIEDYTIEDIERAIKETLFVTDASIKKITKEQKAEKTLYSTSKKNVISIEVEKMDMLMDLVGEIVITESMLTNSPDLRGLQLDNFKKTATQLKRLNSELQDAVLSIRMLPIAASFHNMHSILRDMNKELNKQISLHIIGEETEVDKSIIDRIEKPLLYLVENAVVHGIDKHGEIILSAQNNGSEIVIIVQDNGVGLDAQAIYEKANKLGIVDKHIEDMLQKDIFALLANPAFNSQKNKDSGLAFVKEEIEKTGGTMRIESSLASNTSVILRIPLTLAIIDGMKVSVGSSIFTIPITAIRESMKVEEEQIIKDTSGQLMVMIRGQAYAIAPLAEHFNIETKITKPSDGILVMVESEQGAYCVFADEIIGEQDVVVKPVPQYIKQHQTGETAISGCAILDDSNISIILDVNGLYNTVFE